MSRVSLITRYCHFRHVLRASRLVVASCVQRRCDTPQGACLRKARIVPAFASRPEDLGTRDCSRALCTWKRSVGSKGWKSLFIGGKDCDTFWAFAGVLHLRTGIDTPRAVHRTGLAGDEWHFMHSAVNAFSEACEACRWLASPLLFLIPTL